MLNKPTMKLAGAPRWFAALQDPGQHRLARWISAVADSNTVNTVQVDLSIKF